MTVHAPAFSPLARQQAMGRYAEVGAEWLVRFGVTLKTARKDLTGRAWVKKREIAAPWPTTTRQRLYILAHEIGHCALGHDCKLPRYVEEYEAELFAHALMRDSGLSVPRKMTARAKSYVRHKIRQAFARGAQWIDPDVAAWCGANVIGINLKTPAKKRIRPSAGSAERIRAALTQEPPT